MLCTRLAPSSPSGRSGRLVLSLARVVCLGICYSMLGRPWLRSRSSLLGTIWGLVCRVLSTLLGIGAYRRRTSWNLLSPVLPILRELPLRRLLGQAPGVRARCFVLAKGRSGLIGRG